uniref:hypothetical protein n=1 Tax=Azospirillum argentinense TaxID=2970906 RepID=UPI001FFF07D3|nr:hypothetical protein [Azospirillum argentinense]
MSRSNDFASSFIKAHADAGLERVSIAHILQTIQKDPAFLFSEELRRGGGQCPMHAAPNADDADKVTVNTLLAYLFERLRDHVASKLPLDERGQVMLPIPPRSPTASTRPTARRWRPPRSTSWPRSCATPPAICWTASSPAGRPTC